MQASATCDRLPVDGVTSFIVKPRAKNQHGSLARAALATPRPTSSTTALIHGASKSTSDIGPQVPVPKASHVSAALARYKKAGATTTTTSFTAAGLWRIKATEVLAKAAAPAPCKKAAKAAKTLVKEARVTIWNKNERRKVSGNAAPLERNIEEYLQKHPDCEVYDGQDKGFVRVKSKQKAATAKPLPGLIRGSPPAPFTTAWEDILAHFGSDVYGAAESHVNSDATRDCEGTMACDDFIDSLEGDARVLSEELPEGMELDETMGAEDTMGVEDTMDLETVKSPSSPESVLAASALIAKGHGIDGKKYDAAESPFVAPEVHNAEVEISTDRLDSMLGEYIPAFFEPWLEADAAPACHTPNIMTSQMGLTSVQSG